MRLGYFLSSEEYGPDELVEQAVLAADAGFTALGISDHFHPWNDAQGQSAFVWSVIGALARETSLPVTTLVTCPTVRMHPVIVAQAAATSAAMLAGGFRLGVGTGEALNEHILGGRWPPAETRLEMLEEAVGLIRELWTGEVVSHRGRYYTVDTARIYTLPDDAPPILMSAFGPKALAVAKRIGDGFVSTAPDAESVAAFRDAKGSDALTIGVLKVAYAPTREEGVHHAHRLWATAGLPGELAQILPTPAHFEPAATLVSAEATASSVVAGRDPRQHLDALEPYRKAGFTEAYVANMGPHWRQMVAFYGDEVIPEIEDWT